MLPTRRKECITCLHLVSGVDEFRIDPTFQNVVGVSESLQNFRIVLSFRIYVEIQNVCDHYMPP